MKKVKIISMIFIMLLMISISIVSHAAIDQTVYFDIKYDGEIKVNEEKTTVTTLAGKETPQHTNVRIKVDIEGPSTPKLLAIDSTGKEYDIAQIGYWGPSQGFPIQGNFYNETMVRATYSVAGTYKITLSLIDVQNDDDILAQREFTFEVKGEEPAVTNEVVNEPAQELPKTGTSLIEYAIYAVILLVIVYAIYQIRERRK